MNTSSGKTSDGKREEFGQYIKELRTKNGLTQKEAQSISGISVPYLARLERGERNPPSRRILSKMAKMYNVEPEVLWSKAEQAEGRTKDEESDHRRIEWAFRAVVDDPQFDFGMRILGSRSEIEQLDITIKLVIVKLFQLATGRKLMTTTEIEVAEERITGQSYFDFTAP